MSGRDDIRGPVTVGLALTGLATLALASSAVTAEGTVAVTPAAEARAALEGKILDTLASGDRPRRAAVRVVRGLRAKGRTF